MPDESMDPEQARAQYPELAQVGDFLGRTLDQVTDEFPGMDAGVFLVHPQGFILVSTNRDRVLLPVSTWVLDMLHRKHA